MGAAASGGAEGTVRGGARDLPHTPCPLPPTPLTCAGTGIGAGILQTVDEPICLQLQVLHQLWEVGSGPGLLSSPAPYATPQTQGRWAAYLPERVKLGPLRNTVFARLVLADKVVVHSFPIDQGQCISALLLPGPQPGMGKEEISPL